MSAMDNYVPIGGFGITVQQSGFNNLAGQFNLKPEIATFSTAWSLDKSITTPLGAPYPNSPAGFLYELFVFMYNGVPSTKAITKGVVLNETVRAYALAGYMANATTLAQAQALAEFAAAQTYVNSLP
jgi:hypothetical protein